jgi:hypothetical protein
MNATISVDSMTRASLQRVLEQLKMRNLFRWSPSYSKVIEFLIWHYERTVRTQCECIQHIQEFMPTTEAVGRRSRAQAVPTLYVYTLACKHFLNQGILAQHEDIMQFLRSNPDVHYDTSQFSAAIEETKKRILARGPLPEATNNKTTGFLNHEEPPATPSE